MLQRGENFVDGALKRVFVAIEQKGSCGPDADDERHVRRPRSAVNLPKQSGHLAEEIAQRFGKSMGGLPNGHIRISKAFSRDACAILLDPAATRNPCALGEAALAKHRA